MMTVKNIFRKGADKWALMLFLLLMLPNFIALTYLSDLQGQWGKQVAYLLFAAMLWLLPALFLRAKWYFLIAFPFLLLAPVEIAHVSLSQMPVTEGFLQSFLQTSRLEAFELISSMKLLCVAFIALALLYLFILFAKVKNDYLFTPKVAISLGLLFAVGNALLFAAMWRMADTSSVAFPAEAAKDSFIKKFRKIYPVDLPIVAYRAYIAQRKMQRLYDRLDDFSFGATKQDSTNEKEIYVVVIGETARYGNFSVNGYERPTSPRLEQTEGLLSYSDVYSAANLTATALSFLFTRATPTHPAAGYEEKTFVDAFAEAGFHTAWMASQSGQDPFVKRIVSNTACSYFALTDFDAANNYDEHLLPHLDALLMQGNDRQLVILHTLGSHWRYNFRYPDSFAVFTPCMKGTEGNAIFSPKHKDLLINSYDNTIRYTDHILTSIIHRVQQEQAISAVIFISDHAENLYDDSRHLILHGSSACSEWEVHIPWFIWTSDNYNTKFPSKRNALETHRHKALSSTNLFHTLLDMADIHYSGEQLCKSIASAGFTEDSIRYICLPHQQIVPVPQQRQRYD